MPMDTDAAGAAAGIRALTADACAKLERTSPDELWALADRAGIQTGNCFDERGKYRAGAVWPSSVPLTALYSDAAALDAALSARELPLQAATPALLATADAPAALPTVVGLLKQDFTPFHRLDFESWVFYSLGAALPLVLPVMPPLDIEALWALGKLDSEHHVPAEVFEKMPWERLVLALKQGRAVLGSPDKVLGSRPDLRSPEGVLRRLEEALRDLGDKAPAVIYWLITRLGKDRFVPAIPVLQSLRGSVWGPSADQVLLEIRTPEAVAPIAAELDARLGEAQLAWDPHHVAPGIAGPIEATFLRDPKRATESFARFFEGERLNTDAGAKVAHDILSIGRGVQIDHAGYIARTSAGNLLSEDPRWLDLAASLVRHRRLGPLAKRILSEAPRKARTAALTNVHRDAPPDRAADLPVRSRGPRSPDWLTRYLAGAHEEVWRELADLPAPVEGPLRDDAEAVALETMRRVRVTVERIAPRLRTWVETWATLEGDLFAPPSPRRRASLAALEKATGRPLPLALRAFHEVVGSVDFSLPESFVIDGLQRIDPLVLASVTTALRETKAWRARREAGVARELRDAETPVYLAPSPYMKFRGEVNESDEHPFFARPTAGGVDAIVRHGDDAPISFVAYLRSSLRRGGFMVIREDHTLDPHFSRSFADVGAAGLADVAQDLAAAFEPF